MLREKATQTAPKKIRIGGIRDTRQINSEMILEVLESLTEPVLLFDCDLALEFCNRSYFDLPGLKLSSETPHAFARQIRDHLQRSEGVCQFELKSRSPAPGTGGFDVKVRRLFQWDKTLVILRPIADADGGKGDEIPARGLIRAMESHVVGVVVADQTGTIKEANTAFLRMVGQSRDGVRYGSLNWFALTPVAWRLADSRAMAQVTSTGASCPYKKEYFAGGAGHRVPVLQSLAWVSEPNAEVIAFVVNLTDYRKSERDRASLLVRQTALLGAAGEGIFGLDPDGNCNFINPVACEMLGYTESECIGRNMHELSRYKHADGTRYPREECPAYRALLLGKGSRVDEDLIWRKDGSSLPVSLTTQPVLTDGTVSGAVVTMSDITERQRAEQEKANRSSELARSNLELQQFAYVAAHDLKEPIHTIGGFAEILRNNYSQDFPETATEYLSLIAASVERMSKMISALLSYAELNAVPLVPRVSDCESVLAQALENLDAAIRETGTIVTHEPLPRLWAEEVQLVQLLQNLISNSIKYKAERPGLVHIEAVERGGEWLFAVRDNGIGIPRDDIPNIFDLFRRNSRKLTSGSGIGLATCRKIVERHRGRLWVESRVGVGSTFYFTLPSGCP